MALSKLETGCVFLDAMGIEATKRTDAYNEPYIAIQTSAFDQVRVHLKRWFTPMTQCADLTYLRERLWETDET